jgi:competence protein ComEA
MIGWAVAAVVAVALGAHLLGVGGGGGGAQPAGLTVDPGAGGGPSAFRESRGSSAEVLVQVAGEVAHPGVYRVPAGARVNDAVQRAGGLTRRADQAGVNLVARVQDGQQVIVPRRGAGGGAVASAGSAGGGVGAGGGAGGGPSGGPVSLSSATVAQLDALDGIGPTLAQRIVDYRQAHGGFRSVDQLRDVSGIGDKRFEALRKAVTP